MFLTINGKPLTQCSIKDIYDILDNEDFRENTNIDYKESITFLDVPPDKKDIIAKEKAEFRKDVCALANSQGGYLVFGIKENGKGVPCKITGIAVKNDNIDLLENQIRNALQIISPRIPRYELKSIPFESNYIIVMRIFHDYFSPYIFLENNQDYRVFVRVGNAVRVSTYNEMRDMFNQSMTLEMEIEKYRNKRINYFKQQEDASIDYPLRFLLLHIIPDTFLDRNYNENLFLLNRKNGVILADLFQNLLYGECAIPSADGVRYIGEGDKSEGRIFNNGVEEAFVPLDRWYIGKGPNSDNTEILSDESLWNIIQSIIYKYAERMNGVFSHRVFVCITLIGCKKVITEIDSGNHVRGTIDRNDLLCESVLFEDYSSNDLFNESLNNLKLTYYLSLGIRFKTDLNKLINEIST